MSRTPSSLLDRLEIVLVKPINGTTNSFQSEDDLRSISTALSRRNEWAHIGNSDSLSLGVLSINRNILENLLQLETPGKESIVTCSLKILLQ